MNIIKFTLCILFTLLSQSVYSQDDEDERIFDDQVFIKLKYDACFRGDCPRFEVIILGNGSMLYEGIDGVKKTGIHQKQISRKHVAGLLSNILNTQFFNRKDTSSKCYLNVEVTADAYEESGSTCVISSHGPITDIEVKFGDKHRKVGLEDNFSEDYLYIKNMIIEAAGVEKWIK